jgi:hypothetical protein
VSSSSDATPAEVLPEVRLRRDQAVLVQTLDDQQLALRQGSHEVLHLDEVAATVWALLAEEISESQLCRDLTEHYAVSEDSCGETSSSP